MKRKILVADDDRKTVDLIRLYLEREQHEVLVAYDGREALEMARQRSPALVILDWMLPRVDGLDICRILRAESDVPIIMLTARSTEEDKLLGLDLGADDYVTKPFSPRELVARVRVVLRRSLQEVEAAPTRHMGELDIDFMAHEVGHRGVPVRRTPREFKLLETLAHEPGRAFSHGELVNRVFGLDYEGFDRTLDVHVMNLRKKIEDDPNRPAYLLTVYGIGYKFRRE
ncbi:MAG TPA: response regulator transcription factor [Ktedonobacteraceae bacterium]